MGQTVNLLPCGFDGPNPSSSTMKDESDLIWLIFLYLCRSDFMPMNEDS